MGVEGTGVGNLIDTDGVGTNGVGTNGVRTNGVGTNGVGTDGVGTDGVGTNGVGTNGVGTNGVGTNGVGTDGVGTNGVGTDGVGNDSVADSGGCGTGVDDRIAGSCIDVDGIGVDVDVNGSPNGVGIDAGSGCISKVGVDPVGTGIRVGRSGSECCDASGNCTGDVAGCGCGGDRVGDFVEDDTDGGVVGVSLICQVGASGVSLGSTLGGWDVRTFV